MQGDAGNFPRHPKVPGSQEQPRGAGRAGAGSSRAASATVPSSWTGGRQGEQPTASAPGTRGTFPLFYKNLVATLDSYRKYRKNLER